MRLSEAAYLLPRAIYGFGHLGPRGPEEGDPVLVIPGFIANDRTTMELRRALAEGGYRAFPWNGGWNLGARADTIERLANRLDEIAPGGKVIVVGWSLGGVYARALALAAPERVRAVATLGSPISGDPRMNNVWQLYERIAGHPVDDPPIARESRKPPVPTLTIWSPRDGIVAPRAARGLAEESDKVVELDCSHMAFGVSRATARRVVREIDTFLKSVAR